MDIHQQREDRLIELCNLSDTSNLTKDSWGVYSYVDLGTPCGGSADGSHWFKDKALFNEHVRLLPYLIHNTGVARDMDGFWKVSNQAMDRFEAGEITLLDVRDLMNQALGLPLHIVWMGTLADLMNCEDQEGSNIRSIFWCDQGEAEDVEEKFSPIPDDLLDAFANWIS